MYLVQKTKAWIPMDRLRSAAASFEKLYANAYDRIGGEMMTRRHSLVTRALALVMALVLIASNGAGLTLGAKAAETGNLFELMSAHGCSHEELDAVLTTYADAINGLAEMNTTVSYDSMITAAKGQLRQGVLTVEPVGNWIPYSYLINDSAELFNGNYTVEGLSEDVSSVNIVYKQDLGDEVSQQIAAVHDKVYKLADDAAIQKNTLNKLGTGDAFTGLAGLSGQQIDNIYMDMDLVTAKALGINVEITADLDDDGEITEAEQAYFDANRDKIQEEANKAAAETVKAEYKAILENMMSKVITPDHPYGQEMDKYGAYLYRSKLEIYALLNKYNQNGLPFYYANKSAIINEMDELADILYQILGVGAENGEAYKAAIEYILGGCGGLSSNVYPDIVTYDRLRRVADVLKQGAADLRAMPATVENSIAPGFEDVKGLTNALAVCGNEARPGTEIVMVSAQLPIKDTSWVWVTVTVNGKSYNFRYATETELTQAHIDEMVAKIVAAEPHYNVDTAAVEALVGTAMPEGTEIDVTCAAEPKDYTVDIKDADGKVIDTIALKGNAVEITLPCEKNHEVTYLINGEEKVITAPTVIKASIDELLAMVITVKEDVDLTLRNWQNFVRNVNEALGRADAFTLKDDVLTANISMNELGSFAKVILDMDITSVLLNGKEFMVNSNGQYYMFLQTMIDAMFEDPTFNSGKLIKLGNNGKGNLLNAEITIFESTKKFVLNLTAAPAPMATVANGLSAISSYITFDTNNGSGKLHMNVTLPEKVYEAYVTAELITGNLTNDDFATVNNAVAMQFVKDYFDLLINSDVNTETFSNTLKALGVEKDLTGYEEYYQLLKKVVNDENFFIPNANGASFTIDGKGADVKDVLAMLGFDLKEMTQGVDVILDNEEISIQADLEMTHEAPTFNALVVDPSRLNNAGVKAKLDAVNYTVDLAKTTFQGPAAILLLGDVEGDLTFNSTTILDLNGYKVKGNIVSNGQLFIVDSSMDTVSGATVTGTVTGNVTVLAGTYPAADVKGYLKDGYYLDGKTVKNAMYQIKNGKILVDPKVYLNNVDGYLPAAQYLAADLAIDMALNYFFAAGYDAEGQTLYSVRFEDLVSLLKNKDIAGVADQALASINAAGITNFVNIVIADLLDFGALSNAVSTGAPVATYSFTVYPWAVGIRHEKTENRIEFDIQAGTNGKTYTLSLAVNVPAGDAKDKLVKVLNALDAHVVDGEENTKIAVTLDQPKRDGKNLLVSGSGTAKITLDFSMDAEYNRMLAGVIAYFNDELTDELVNNGCIIDLNKAMSTVTVGDFFTAVEGVIKEDKITFADIAEKLGITLPAEDAAKLEKLFDAFKSVCTKVINKFGLTTNSTAPLSELADGSGVITVNGDIAEYTADAYLKGYGLIAKLNYTDATLIIRLAPKCTEILGDADNNGTVALADLVLIRQYLIGKKTADDLHMCVCDLDGDGQVRLADLVLLRQFLIGKITKFPVEQ